jgi:outer membrane immunogenic protein
MKKLVVALSALAAFTGSALAADMAPRPYTKAPAPVAYAPSWTGCYVGGGGGYGMWQQENTTYDNIAPPRTAVTTQWDAGGRGYFGTVQGGCDYQFSIGLPWQMVVGAFGDYDFADIKGNPSDPFSGFGGREKLSSQWAVGGRIGAVVLPSLLTYFTAGYTEAKFDSINLVATSATNLFALGPNAATGLYVPGHTYKGWFLGAGDEYALSFLPGLFWKTEYRFSELDVGTNLIRVQATNALTGFEVDSKKYIHTVRSELVYRFNWGGPVVAKY